MGKRAALEKWKGAGIRARAERKWSLHKNAICDHHIGPISGELEMGQSESGHNNAIL